MSRATSNQQANPHGGQVMDTSNNPTMSNQSHQAATRYAYPTYAQLNQQNSNASVSAMQLTESIAQRLAPSLNTTFLTLHQNTMKQLDNIQTSIQALSKNLSDAREDAHKETLQVTHVIEASHALQTKAIKRVLDRVDKFEKVVVENDGLSLIDRISSIEFAVAELVERAQDPDAHVTSNVRRNAATSPMREVVSPVKQHKDALVGRSRPQSPSPLRVSSPVVHSAEPRELPLEKAGEALRSRIRASVDALKSAIGGDLFEDSPVPGPSHSSIRSEPEDIDHQDIQVEAATTPSRFPTTPFAADRLAKPAEWSTKGVHPSSIASASVTRQVSTSDANISSKPGEPGPQQVFSPAPIPTRPARDIPEGTVAALRQTALGNHLFVRPLEDTGLPKLDPKTAPPLDVSYPPPGPNTSATSSILPSPPSTTSPEGISFELPDVIMHEDTRDPVSTTPGTSPSLPEGPQDNQVKHEVDAISCMIPPASAQRREETDSPLSVPEDDELEQSVSNNGATVNAFTTTSSNFQRAESLSSLSSLSALENELESEQPLLKSHSAVTDNPTSICGPGSKLRRSKRKSNGTNLQLAKKVKLETLTVTIPAPKKLPATKQTRPASTSVLKSKSKVRSKSTSKSAAPTFYDWPTKMEGDRKCQYIQCDNCGKWYHYGCVGIVAGDLRLEDDEQFICPPCHHEPATRVTMRGQEDVCARPDCSYPGHAEEEGDFVVERIVGRKPTADDNNNFLWLIKWDGYPITMASWCPEENMGDCGKLVLKFNEDVAAEGLDIDTDQLILLEEAIAGGWSE